MWSQTATTTSNVVHVTLTYSNHDITGGPTYGCTSIRIDVDKELAKLEKARKRLFRVDSFPRFFETKPSPKKYQLARHGFQQMCRLPCYRGVRTR